MREYIKRQSTELLQTLEEAHAEIVKSTAAGNADTAMMLLVDCQQAAIGIGDLLDEEQAGEAEVIHVLEGYCECTYEIHEALAAGAPVDAEETGKRLGSYTAKAKEMIEALPSRREAVFLPYKASMWDSLESIWQEAQADPDCDAYVLPIPYYDKSPDGKVIKEHWEFASYPDEVPVLDYRIFDMAAYHPEFIFIHNPYDENNHVTTVHPDYYSGVLRDQTECLVYVPYFASAGDMAESQALLPSYFYCDLIVVQSQTTIGFYDAQVPRDKFLPLGSPKFDRVIRLCKNPPAPPAEWAERLKGRRTFFFNTSLNGFLADTEAFLKKMAYVFDTFAGREDACLIWRPHPLFESTMDSLRPDARPAYDALKKRFVEEGIGILDETPDIERTIALCDAYVGDPATSVTALFGVAGKQMFILNNSLHTAPGPDDWKAWVAAPVRGDRNDRYCVTMGNRLFEDADRNGQYRFFCDVSDEYEGGGYYSTAVETAGKIVLFPANAEHILVIDPATKEKKKIDLLHRIDRNGIFNGAFNFPLSDRPEKWYIYPNRYPMMVCFDAETESVEYIVDEAFKQDFGVFINDRQERIFAPRLVWLDEGPSILTEETKDLEGRVPGTERMVIAPDGTEHTCFTRRCPALPGIDLPGPKLVCIDTEGKRLRAIQLETLEVQERAIALDGMYFAALRDYHDLDVFWFLPYQGTVLGKWTLSEDKWEHVDVRIEGLASIRRPQRKPCEDWYFSGGIFHNGKLILAPTWGNKFVELDVHTHEVKEWAAPFPWTTEDINDYRKNWSVGYFYRDAYDLSACFYYAPEQIIYKIDLDSQTAEPVEKSFDREDVFALAPGFYRNSQWMPYCCFEDVFNSLKDIAAGDIHGPAHDRARQLDAYRVINASPDGDCGKKVYEVLTGRKSG